MSSRKKLKDNLFLISSALLSCFVVFPMKLTVLLIAFWFITAVFESNRDKDFPIKENLKWFIPLTIFFFVYSLSILFSGASKEALHLVERKLALIVIPLGFFLVRRRINKNEFKIIIEAFQFSCFVLAVYTLAVIIPDFINNAELLTIEGFNFAFRYSVESISGVHPTYLSIIFLFSTYIHLDKLLIIKERKTIVYNVYSLLNLIILISICLLLVARGPLLFFFISASISFLFKNWKKGAIIVTTTIVIFSLLIIFVPVISNRFKEVFSAKEITQEKKSLTSSNIRVSINECSVELVKKNWLKGVGLSSIQTELNNCYQKFNNPDLIKSNYNTHNQYFDIIISLGILGMISFLIMLLYLSFSVVKTHFFLFFFFKLFIILCFLTENILSRQYGVVFFSFFNSLFVFYLINTIKQNNYLTK